MLYANTTECLEHATFDVHYVAAKLSFGVIEAS